MQKFELKRITEISPGCGEDLGNALARFATAEEERFRAIETASVAHWCHTVAQVLYLAAEAFEQGAGASIGHNRSARYEEEAGDLRKRAEKLEAEGKAVRDAHEGKILKQAFLDGYEDDQNAKNWSFDRREAMLIGRYFAANGLAIPERILKIYSPRPLTRDSERDHLLVDGTKFVVDYPDGKVVKAVVTQIA